MRQVIWSSKALADYFDILHHIAQDDPDAADRVTDRISATGEALGEFATGHPGRVADTYEKSVRGLPYIIAYMLSDDDTTIIIVRVIHTSRNWQTESWPD